jgi:hypothetical protein
MLTGCSGCSSTSNSGSNSGSGVSRHQSLPLRLPQADLNAAVEARPLQCTHFDAFRFYALDAQPLNLVQPTRSTQVNLDQPGCVHANMDLFK